MRMKAAEKDECIVVIKEGLLREPAVVFAYLHGSFVSGASFNDIDVAVFFAAEIKSFLETELYLEAELEAALAAIGLTALVDVKSLNAAPLAFRYQASKNAILLCDRDETTRVDFEAHARSLYFDFMPLRDKYIAGVLGRAV